MVRPEIDLEPYKESIIDAYQSGSKRAEIVKFMFDHYAVEISVRTLATRLKTWDIFVQRRVQDTPNLRARIAALFYESCLSDEIILRALHVEGFTITLWSLIRLRKTMGIKRRLVTDDVAQADRDLEAIVQAEFDKGSIEGYGRGHLYTHFRSQYHIASRDRLFAAVRTLDPDGVQRRRRDWVRQRGEYIVPGPNYIWSLDGHLKLAPFGIEIYAAIDAYSRYVLWVYVGVSACTAVSVLRQYLDTVQDYGIQPLILRSDRGGETLLMAEAHYQLRQAASSGELAFADCYYYGTSTSNQRIESWWGQMSKSQLFGWRVCLPSFVAASIADPLQTHFKNLQGQGLYSADRLADKIALLAIYVPIIRSEVANFARLWNAHKIRRQKGSSVSGQPLVLYQYPSEDVEDYGVPIVEETRSALEVGYNQWG
jgi:hypothetical protein